MYLVLIVTAVIIYWSVSVLASESKKEASGKAPVENPDSRQAGTDGEEGEPALDVPRRKWGMGRLVLIALLILAAGLVIRFKFFAGNAMLTIKTAMEECLRELGVRPGSDQDLADILAANDVSTQEELDAILSVCVEDKMKNARGWLGHVLRTADGEWGQTLDGF